MDLPKRKPNRLNGYDYSQNNAYFITICIKNRQEMLWNVGATCGRPPNNQHLSQFGVIVENEIHKIEKIYINAVFVDKFVIMPNNLHLIIVLNDNNVCDNGRPKVAPTISRIVQQFKGSITKQIGYSIWQKLFHDHIIRNEQEYQQIWQYIDTNPMEWENDCIYNHTQY